MPNQYDQEISYRRKAVPGDGNCGYSALGIPRERAFDILQRQFNEGVVNPALTQMIQPAVREAIYDENGKFWHYLTNEINVNDDNVTYQDFLKGADYHSANSNLISHYLVYDILRKRIQGGWAHPAVLRTVALAEGIDLKFWTLDSRGTTLKPHRAGKFSQDFAYDFWSSPEVEVKEVRHVLFTGGNHFEKLEFTHSNPSSELASFQPDDPVDTSDTLESVSQHDSDFSGLVHELLNDDQRKDSLIEGLHNELIHGSKDKQELFDQELAKEWQKSPEMSYENALALTLAKNAHCFSAQALTQFGLFAASRSNGIQVSQQQRCGHEADLLGDVHRSPFVSSSQCSCAATITLEQRFLLTTGATRYGC